MIVLSGFWSIAYLKAYSELFLRIGVTLIIYMDSVLGGFP